MKPIVNKINTFDPNSEYTFSFTCNGNQSMSNRLIITDNDTNVIVYDNTVVSMKLEQILPANTLESNKQYSAQFQSFDSSNNASSLSDKTYFYCLKTPVFELTNVISKIKNSSYEFVLHYSQEEAELLKEYKIVLYDSSKSVVIKDSGVLYATKDVSDILYNITALEDDTKYYIQAFGTTVHGMEIQTEKCEFYVSYIRPSQYAAFYTENDADNGCIRFSTNIIVVQYNGDETFEYINGYINLVDKKIYYDSGFNITGDFVVKLIGTKLSAGEIFRMSNDKYNIILNVITDENGYFRIVMKAENLLSNAMIISEPFECGNDKCVLITFYRKDGYYGINTIVKDLNVDIEAIMSDMYIGDTTPVDPSDSSIYLYDNTMRTVRIDGKDVVITFGATRPSNPKNLDMWIEEKGEV